MNQPKILNFTTPQETIGELLSYHNELNQSSGSIYAKLLRSRVKDFYNNNGERIKSAFAKIKELHAKYYEIDEKGERIIIEKELPLPEGAPEGTQPQKQKEYVLKQDMTVEKYREEYTGVMNQPCSIIW